jgi:hypothetical protein
MAKETIPTVGNCTSFRLSSAINTHIVAYAECRGCSKPPTQCNSPECGGLIHHEEIVDADGDEHTGWFDVWRWVESQCDRCGETEDRGETTLETVQRGWSKREERRRRDQERTRLEMSPTPAEVAQAWISAVKKNTLGKNVQDGFDILGCDEQSPVQTEHHESVEEEALRGVLPDIKRVVRPPHAAGDLQKLFFSPLKAQIFGAFEAELALSPLNRVVRAAAIAFYWQLANYIPGGYEAGYTVDDDGEFKECDEWVRDNDPAYLPIRRLFTSILGNAASYGKVSEIASWEEAQWEMRNAYAASDWPRARKIFDHIERKKMRADIDVVVLRLQFEGLLILGPHIDALSKRIRASTDISFQWQELRQPFGRKLSLEHLDIETDLLCWSVSESRPERSLVLLPLLGLAAPLIPNESQLVLERLLSKLHPHYSELPDRGLLQRALSAFLYEGMGERGHAAEQYLALGTEYTDLLGEGNSVVFRFRAVDQLHADGQIDLAIKMFLELLGLNATESLSPIPLARRAVSLGLLEQARQILSELSDKEREALDPFLQRALAQDNGLLFRQTEEKCRKWICFDRLTPSAQDSWLHASLCQQSKKESDAVRRESKRIAVELYGRAVELELGMVFASFREDKSTSLVKRRMDPLTDRFMNTFLNGGHMTLGQMETVLRRLGQGGGIGDVDRLLNGFFIEHYPGLLRYKTLEILGKLRPARNEACHDTTTMQPNQAQSHAKEILETIHLQS